MKQLTKISINTVRVSSQLICLLKVSASSQPEPRSMKWESSGELAQRDLSELVTRLLDAESGNNTAELTRLGSKYEKES